LVVDFIRLDGVDTFTGGGKVGKPYWLTGRRALIALCIMAVLAPFAVYAGRSEGPGRPPDDYTERIHDLNRCLVACIKLTIECRGNCAPQCEVLYGHGGQQYHACWRACQDSCSMQRFNCTAICKFDFNGVTPELP